MKRLSKKQELQDLLTGSKRKDKLIMIEGNDKIPEGHQGAVIKFVDFAKQNEKIKAD